MTKTYKINGKEIFKKPYTTVDIDDWYTLLEALSDKEETRFTVGDFVKKDDKGEWVGCLGYEKEGVVVGTDPLKVIEEVKQSISLKEEIAYILADYVDEDGEVISEILSLVQAHLVKETESVSMTKTGYDLGKVCGVTEKTASEIKQDIIKIINNLTK